MDTQVELDFGELVKFARKKINFQDVLPPEIRTTP